MASTAHVIYPARPLSTTFGLARDQMRCSKGYRYYSHGLILDLSNAPAHLDTAFSSHNSPNDHSNRILLWTEILGR